MLKISSFSWVNKLFISPSRLVLLTGAALLGTCGFLAGIVGILHWREKVRLNETNQQLFETEEAKMMSKR